MMTNLLLILYIAAGANFAAGAFNFFIFFLNGANPVNLALGCLNFAVSGYITGAILNP